MNPAPTKLHNSAVEGSGTSARLTTPVARAPGVTPVGEVV